jgi:hypothetical protein
MPAGSRFRSPASPSFATRRTGRRCGSAGGSVRELRDVEKRLSRDARARPRGAWNVLERDAETNVTRRGQRITSDPGSVPGPSTGREDIAQVRDGHCRRRREQAGATISAGRSSALHRRIRQRRSLQLIAPFRQRGRGSWLPPSMLQPDHCVVAAPDLSPALRASSRHFERRAHRRVRA